MAAKKTFDPVTLIGLAIAMAIMIGGQYYVASTRPPPPPPGTIAPPPVAQVKPGETKSAESPSGPGTVSAAGETKSPDKETAPPETPAAPDITIDAGTISLVLTAEGAAVRKADLPGEYLDPLSKQKKGLELLAEIEPGRMSLSMPYFEFGSPDSAKQQERIKVDETSIPQRAMNRRKWTLEKDSGSFDAEGKRTVEYSTALDGYFKVIRIYTITKGSRFIEG